MNQAVFLLLLMASVSWGAGFEKATTWSGRFVGMGSTGVSLAKGAESLYFNPAGLANPGGEASVNFSPTFIRYQGPVSAATGSFESNRKLSPVIGFLASYGINENLGFGIGHYVSGGAKATYEGVDLSKASSLLTFKPDIKNELSIRETAIGLGYQIIPGLRVGAAWRIMHINADVSGPSGLNTEINLTDLSTTTFDGFKAGVQYEAADKGWGLGLSWRSEVSFIAKGKGSTRSSTATTESTTETTAASTFPQQFDLGGFYQVTPMLKLVPGWTFTQYAKVKSIEMGGTVNGLSASTLSANNLGWKNQHNFRLGTEYAVTPRFDLRAGYILTTMVTPTENATLVRAAPGTGHTFVIGAGTVCVEDKFRLDGALEYGVTSGTGVSPGVTGDFKTDVYAAHFGGTLKF